MTPLADSPWSAAPPRLSGSPQGSTPPRKLLGGQSVRVKEGASLLADAAEEVGLHLSEKIERRTLAARRVAPGRSDQRLSLAAIQAYFDKTGRHQDPTALLTLVRDLLQRVQQEKGPWDGRGFPRHEATDRYLLLQYALQAGLPADTPAAVIEQMEAALADLEAQAGNLIQADLASIDQAASFGQSSQAIAQFQLSVHAILEKPTLAQTFQTTLSLAGNNGNRLGSAIDHLMQALGACLAALGASHEKILLEALVKDLFHLKCLNTLFEQAKQVTRNLKTHPRHTHRPSEEPDGACD